MSPHYIIIGIRIKNTRMEQRLTQEELADKIDVSVAFLSRVERGHSKINLKRLTQIAEILNVSPGYLLTGSNIASKDYLREDFSQVLDQCTPKQQRLIYAISELISRTNFEDEENEQ